MDWNRDGKVDAHDATLYHTVINNDSSFESSGSSCGSGSAGWIIAVIVIAILYFFS